MSYIPAEPGDQKGKQLEFEDLGRINTKPVFALP
jgi:hypothetical protein